MDQLRALRETVEAYRHLDEVISTSANSDLPESLRLPHIELMLEKVEADLDPVTGKHFNDAKLGRWLGWAQAAAVAAGALTLDQCKAINQRNA